MDQIEKLKTEDMGEKTPTKPSFLHAAQRSKRMLSARMLMAFSHRQTGREPGRLSDRILNAVG